MTFKRRVLSALGKAELLALGRDLDLEVKAGMTVEGLREALARSKRAKLNKLVTVGLDRDTLKAICQACDLDPTGREKQVLVDRILGAAGVHVDADDDAAPAASQAGLGLPAIDEATNAAARASLATTPRVPRARRGQDDGADAATNVVSYRHRDRRRNNPEVGMVDPDTDPGQPKTTWKYDPHLDPALAPRSPARRLRDLRHPQQHAPNRAARAGESHPRPCRCVA